MSDNVSKFEPNPGRKLRKKLVIFILLFVLAVGACAIYLFRDSVKLDAVGRFFKYSAASQTAAGSSFTFDSHNANQYADFDGGLAIATTSGLHVYRLDGEEAGFLQAKLDIPAIRAGEKIALAFDVGGTRLLAASKSGEQVLDITTEKQIFDADCAEDGSICFAAPETGYKTVLHVYDAKQNLIYRWRSSSSYLPLCAVSKGAGYVAGVSYGQNNGIFAANLHIFDTASDAGGMTAPLAEELVYDLAFVDEETLCAVSESGAQWFTAAGEKLASYTISGAYLEDFDFGGDGFLSLVVNMYKAGNQCNVLTLDRAGAVLGSAGFDVQILDFSAAGDYLAVLTAEKLTIYHSDMQPYLERTNAQSATNVIQRSDGSALLLGGGRGEIVLP